MVDAYDGWPSEVDTVSRAEYLPRVRGEFRGRPSGQRTVKDLAGQRQHLRTVGGDDPRVGGFGSGRPGLTVHSVSVLRSRRETGG
jgi:hypothetical protein